MTRPQVVREQGAVTAGQWQQPDQPQLSWDDHGVTWQHRGTTIRVARGSDVVIDLTRHTRYDEPSWLGGVFGSEPTPVVTVRAVFRGAGYELRFEAECEEALVADLPQAADPLPGSEWTIPLEVLQPLLHAALSCGARLSSDGPISGSPYRRPPRTHVAAAERDEARPPPVPPAPPAPSSRPLNWRQHVDDGTLNLSSMDLSAADLQAVLQDPGLAEIHYLQVFDNPIGDEGAAAVAHCPHLGGLTDLQIGSTGLTDDGLRALAQSPHLAKLGELVAYHNDVGDEGVREGFAS